jgi:hypothetical protein
VSFPRVAIGTSHSLSFSCKISLCQKLPQQCTPRYKYFWGLRDTETGKLRDECYEQALPHHLDRIAPDKRIIKRRPFEVGFDRSRQCLQKGAPL